jgi:AhpD family alkylhydroperoxidase
MMPSCCGTFSSADRRDDRHPSKEPDMTDPVYPAATRELARRRHELAPGTEDAFLAFSRQVFADGALSARTKQIIAVAVAHVTQCPYCIKGHTAAALRQGASSRELMEAIWVAAEMRAGASFAHSVLALGEIEKLSAAAG